MSLNISNFSLPICKNCNPGGAPPPSPLKKVKPLFSGNPLSKLRSIGSAHYDDLLLTLNMFSILEFCKVIKSCTSQNRVTSFV